MPSDSRLFGFFAPVVLFALLVTLACPAQELADIDPEHPRLHGADDILAELDEVTWARIIVLLSPSPEITAFASWDDPRALRDHQSRVKALQTPVLDNLAANEWQLRNRLDNAPAFSGSVTTAGLAKLLADPRVRAIEPVIELAPHTKQGIALVEAVAIRDQLDGGDGISIAICDTGLDYLHPDLGGGGFPNAKVIGGDDIADGDGDPYPDGTADGAHGTACAGIAGGFQAGPAGLIGDYVGGIADRARLYALKITPDNSMFATNDDMAMAWDWCVTHKNDDPTAPILVISTSFGGGRFLTPCDSEPAYMMLNAAAQNAVGAGITVVASSGNDGFCDALEGPACLSNVIAVGAVYDAAIGQYDRCVDPLACVGFADPTCMLGTRCLDGPTQADLVTCYSNVAPFLDILGPSNNAHTLDSLGNDGYTSGAYVSNFGGTSAACPYVAGSVALLQAAALRFTGSYLTPAQVRTFLTTSGDLVVDPRTGDTFPRINVRRAVHALSAVWGLPGGDVVNIGTDVFADNFDTDPPDDPLPLGEMDSNTTTSFIPGLFGNSMGAFSGVRVRDKFFGFPETVCSSQANGMVLVDGEGTPELVITWWTYTHQKSDVEVGHFATAMANLMATINLSIEPSASTPIGTPVTVWVSWDQFAANNSQSETTGNPITGEGEDIANIMGTTMSLAGTELLMGRFDFANPPFPPFSSQGFTLRDESAVITSVAVGDQFPFEVTAMNDSLIQLPGKPFPNALGIPCFQLCDDLGNTAFFGRMRLSLVGPPGTLTIPGAQPGPPPRLDQTDFAFSLDIGSDTEISDPSMDGDEVFDPGDAYAVALALLPPGGADGIFDDATLFGLDPFPDPPFGAGTAAPTCSGGPQAPDWFDMDGVDRLNVSLDGILSTGVLPVPRFPSSCIHNGEHLMVSFDDDGPNHYTEPMPCDVPVTETATSGATFGTAKGKDEVVAITVVRGPLPSAVTSTLPLAEEDTVHASLTLNPDLAEDVDDDVDAIDYKDPGALCDVWYYSPDDEGPSTALYDPGSVYEVTAAGPVQVVDDVTHLGLPEETDIDAFEFVWLFDPITAAEQLALVFSVDQDDPTTIDDETGGLDPALLYGSFLTGSWFEFLLVPVDPDGDDIDGVTASVRPLRPVRERFRFRGPALFLGYPPSGVCSGDATLFMEEDATNDGFPNDTLGFTMGLAHDPQWLAAVDVVVAPGLRAVNGGAGPDFFAPQIFLDGVVVDVIYDTGPGMPEVLAVPLATDVVTVTYDGNAPQIAATAAGVVTELRWSDQIAGVTTPNAITLTSGVNAVPHQIDIEVQILPNFGGVCFVRGDCNDDAAIDVSDPITALDHMFAGGYLFCRAACDFNDDDQLTLADAVGLLAFVFMGGPAPAAPFPGCGVDVGANCAAYSSCPTPCP